MQELGLDKDAVEFEYDDMNYSDLAILEDMIDAEIDRWSTNL